jgi:phage gp16-like protein
MPSPARMHPAIEAGRRRAELAAIHTAKRQLALDDDTYRAIVMRISATFRGAGAVSSAGDMSSDERRALIDELRRLGFERTPAAAAQRRRIKDKAQAQLILRLWRDLSYLGIDDPSEQHLSRFIRRMTGVDRVEWLTIAQAVGVIEGLKAWRDRLAAQPEQAT